MFSSDQIADVQGFNKVYLYLCKRIDSAILDAGYSLTEKDVLLEISKTERCTANILTQQLHIDRSYMSRMIAKFEKKGLIEKSLSKTDSRVRYIRLTELGRREFNRLSDIQSAQIRNIFQKLSDEDQQTVLNAMVMIRNKLSDANDVITIRPFTQSDIEYVISRHKTLYYAERHLSDVFSAYVDRIVYEFVDKFNADTDCLNILECNGVPAGSIAVARVDCREKGYKKVFLLTITAQVVARHVYETHGFYKVWSRDKYEWGEGVIEERWDLDLQIPGI